MKFIADVMLGRLAKRMRLLGFDVLYDRTCDDNEIIRLALRDCRVILTRDRALAARPLATRHLLIESDRVREQMEQVLASSPKGAHPLTRCSECNEPLVLVSKRDVQDLVPPFVYDRHEEFLRCPRCERVYWKGTHVERMALPLKKNSRSDFPTGS